MTPPEEAFPDAPPKNLGGRPPKLTASDATLQQLAGLGSIQATKPEVAAVFGVTMPTLRLFFNSNPEALAAYENGQGVGKMSLRRRQWKTSEKSAQMQIWLGKNWLGQADRSKHEHTGKDGAPIATFDLSKLTSEELDAYEALALKLSADAEGAEPDHSSGDAGGDPGGEGSEGFGEEPI